MTAVDSDALDQTLMALQARPWRGVLLGRQSKKPTGDRWQITADATPIVNWVGRDAGNLGNLCHEGTGLAVLDPDDLVAWSEMIDELGQPGAAWVKTGSGKLHYYVRWEPGLPAKLIWRDKIIGEIQRGPGQQQVVMPPSIHPDTGRRYEWLVDPATEPLEPLPPLWRAYLIPEPPAAMSTTTSGIADAQYLEAALRQPGAKRKPSGAVKFQCAGCLAEGHDHHRDNAVVWPSGRWGCAVGGRDHNRAIAEQLGVERARLALPVNGNGHHPIGETAAPTVVGRSAIIIPAATITPETIEWLWPGRLAVGALTNVVGLPDQGKTLLFCDIAARLTTGSPMPPAPRGRVQEPQRALILTLEDSLAATIVPRLIKAGADLGLIDFIKMVQNADGSTSLLTLAEDLDVLDSALRHAPYGLLVVDGITGYLGRDAKTHNDADVRRVLTPFTELLDRAKVSGLSVMHPPKAVTNLAYYAGGSVAFTAVPRVSLGVAPEPNDDSENPRRLLIKIKGNLYGAVPTLAYRITSTGPGDVPWLEWSPETVAVNIADVLDPVREDAEDRSSRRACEEFLRSYLADNPRPAPETEQACVKAGFKPMTIRRARERVVEVAKRSFDGPWVWSLKARPR